MSFLCSVGKCEMEFNTWQELTNHMNDPNAYHGEKKVSQIKADGTKVIEKEPEEIVNALNDTLEISLQKEVVDAQSYLHQKQSEGKDKKIKEKPKEKEKIKLEYVYRGVHDCGNKVETLEIDVGEKHYVIAFCSVCKEQAETKQVSKLK